MVLFGRSQGEAAGDLPADVEVQFAKTRPITIDIEEGLVRITLRIIYLTKKDRLRLSRFMVRANYRPQIDGMSAFDNKQYKISLTHLYKLRIRLAS